jgi:hypothetical protein
MCLVLHNGSNVLFQASLIKCLVNSNLYYYRTANLFIILILYVDDLFIIRNDEHEVTNLKSQFMAHFCMIYLGLVWKYHGIKFKRTKCGLLFHQLSYVNNTKTINATIYQCTISNYNYLTKTLPNLQYIVNIVCWHMHEPHSEHLHVAFLKFCYI